MNEYDPSEDSTSTLEDNVERAKKALELALATGDDDKIGDAQYALEQEEEILNERYEAMDDLEAAEELEELHRNYRRDCCPRKV